MLHTLANNKNLTTIKNCLQILNQQQDAALLLYQDAVCLALADTEFSNVLINLSKSQVVYILEEDVLARGLINKIISQVNLISYQDFVELTIKHHKTISW